MSLDEAVIESPTDELQQQTEVDNGSSDDLRSALQSATREVTERMRDDQGRFAREDAARAAAAANNGAPPAVAPVAGTVPNAEPKPQGLQAQPLPIDPAAQPGAQQVVQPPRAPDAWSPAAKAKFATLDPEIQAEIAKRETEVHKGFTRQDDQRTLGKNFEQAMQPYLAMIRSEGSDPIRAAATVMQTAYNLRAGTQDQKEQLLIGLMNQYQIDPNRVFQRLSGGYQQSQVDPQVAALHQQVQQLQQVIQGGQQQAEQAAQAQIHQTIESFASDPKNTYFSNVRHQMGTLISMADREGRELGLQEAYDQACWAHPQIRPLLLQQQAQQQQTQARDKAARARAAGSSLTGSSVGSANLAPSAAGNESLSDTIRAAMREVMERDA